MDVKKEVYRYLGYNRIYEDPQVDGMVADALQEIYRMKAVKSIYRIFEIAHQEEAILLLENKMTIRSRDLSDYLKDALRMAVMAVTLGAEVDRKIHYYSKTHLTKSLVFNACANAVVEESCDQMQREIAECVASEAFCLTDRFSPGYGDFEISYQQDLLKLLDAHRKIGLSVTEEYIMIPRKSVTAVMGIQKDKKENMDRCRVCNQSGHCEYRARGIYCGNKRAD